MTFAIKLKMNKSMNNKRNFSSKLKKCNLNKVIKVIKAIKSKNPHQSSPNLLTQPHHNNPIKRHKTP